MPKTLDVRLNDGVRDALGALQFQVIVLQAENAALTEQLAELTPPPAGPPAPPEGST